VLPSTNAITASRPKQGPPIATCLSSQGYPFCANSSGDEAPKVNQSENYKCKLMKAVRLAAHWLSDPKEHKQWPPRRRARTTIDVAKTDGQYITIRSFLLIQGVVDFGEGPGNLRPSGQTTVAKATCQLEW